MKKIIIVVFVVVLVGAGLGLGLYEKTKINQPQQNKNNYQNRGNGQSQNSNQNQNNNQVSQNQGLIKIDNPKPNQVVSSPLKITGQARGNWFFEGSFPVKLVDNNGKVLATAIAQAKGEWMTENFVAFETIIDFQATATTSAFLVLQKDNPSGLPQYDAYVRLPITFLPSK